MGAWLIEVCQSAYILYVEKLENIVDTKANLNVWLFTIHNEASRPIVAHRENEQIFITRFVWVVFVGQCSPHGSHTEHLAPFKMFDKWYTIE